jgi:hypothetical protein
MEPDESSGGVTPRPPEPDGVMPPLTPPRPVQDRVREVRELLISAPPVGEGPTEQRLSPQARAAIEHLFSEVFARDMNDPLLRTALAITFLIEEARRVAGEYRQMAADFAEEVPSPEAEAALKGSLNDLAAMELGLYDLLDIATATNKVHEWLAPGGLVTEYVASVRRVLTGVESGFIDTTALVKLAEILQSQQSIIDFKRGLDAAERSGRADRRKLVGPHDLRRSPTMRGFAGLSPELQETVMSAFQPPVAEMSWMEIGNRASAQLGIVEELKSQAPREVELQKAVDAAVKGTPFSPVPRKQALPRSSLGQNHPTQAPNSPPHPGQHPQPPGSSAPSGLQQQ